MTVLTPSPLTTFNTFNETEEEKKRREEKEKLEEMQSSVEDNEFKKYYEELGNKYRQLSEKQEEPVLPDDEFYKKYEDLANTYRSLNSFQSSTTTEQETLEDTPETSELVELGGRLEKTTFENLYRIFKAGTMSLTNDKSVSENIKAVERQRRDKVFQTMKTKYGTDFKKYEDELSVFTGRAAVAFFDPVTFLVPWAKIAKVGKLGATGIGAGIASSDMAIYDYATHGEVDPTNVLFAAGLGGASTLAGTAISNRLSNKLHVADDPSINLGKSEITGKENIVKSSIVDTPAVKLSTKEAQDLEEATAKALIENTPILKELEKSGGATQLFLKAKDNIKKYKDLKEDLAKLEGSFKNIKINPKIEAEYQQALKFANKEFSPLIKNVAKGKATVANGTVTVLGKQGKLTPNIMQAITQSFASSVLGGGVGFSIGTFIEDDADESALPISFAMAGVALGAFHRSINKNPYVTKAVKDRFNDSWSMSRRIALHNFLKVNTAGTLATKNIAHGGENDTLARLMFQIQGGDYKNVVGVEQAADIVSTHFFNRISKVLSTSSLKEQSAAFKIIRKLDTEKNAIKEFNLNKTEAANMRTLVANVEDFRKEFGVNYVKAAGIKFDELENYGLPQFYNNQILADPKGFKKSIREAVKIQNKDKKLTAKKINKKTNDIFDNMTGGGIKNYIATDQKTKKIVNMSAVPYLENFKEKRYFTDIEAIKKLEPYLENNLNDLLNKWVMSSVRSIEFARVFGEEGQVINKLLDSLHKKYQNGILDEKQHGKKVKLVQQTINSYFKTHGTDSALNNDATKTAMSLLTFLANTSMLPRAAISQTADFVQPFVNSSFGSAAKALLTPYRKDSNYAYKLGIARGKSTTLEKDLEALISSASSPTNAFQLALNKATHSFFKFNQMQRLTDGAARFAFNAGVRDAFKFSKTYAGKNVVPRKIRTQLNQMGLDNDDLKYLSKFNSIDEILKDTAGTGTLLKAGKKIQDRDVGVPTTGNRLVFSQSQDPIVRSLGLFLSWTQYKTSQLNSLLKRVQDGDTRLALKMIAGVGIISGLRELQIFASPHQAYYENNTPERFSGKWWQEGAMLSGMVDWRIEKAVRATTGHQFWLENASPTAAVVENFRQAIFNQIPKNLSENDIEGAFVKAVKPTVFNEFLSLYNRMIAPNFDLDELEDNPSNKRKTSFAYAEGGRVELAEGGDPEDRNNMYAGESFFETTRPSLRAILEKRREEREDDDEDMPRTLFGVGGLVSLLKTVLQSKKLKEETAKAVSKFDDMLKEKNWSVGNPEANAKFKLKTDEVIKEGQLIDARRNLNSKSKDKTSKVMEHPADPARPKINTIHKSSGKNRFGKGTAATYDIAVVTQGKNKLGVDQILRHEIATGSIGKTPMAAVRGNYTAKVLTPENLKAKDLKEILKKATNVFGFNPKVGNTFVDVETGLAIKAFDGIAVTLDSQVFAILKDPTKFKDVLINNKTVRLFDDIEYYTPKTIPKYKDAFNALNKKQQKTHTKTLQNAKVDLNNPSLFNTGKTVPEEYLNSPFTSLNSENLNRLIGGFKEDLTYLTYPKYAALKGKKVDMSYMSPDEYLKKVETKLGFKGIEESRIKGVGGFGGQQHIDNLKEAMKKIMEGKKVIRDGVEYDGFAPVALYLNSQEGIHRTIAAKQLGIEKIPVITERKIDKVDQEVGYNYFKEEDKYFNKGGLVNRLKQRNMYE